MFNRFNAEKDDIQKHLENINSQPTKEERKGLKEIPMAEGLKEIPMAEGLKEIPMADSMLFMKGRIDKINQLKKEALAANIIRNSKPNVLGSHGY